jgi:hypothetical protein
VKKRTTNSKVTHSTWSWIEWSIGNETEEEEEKEEEGLTE